MLHRFVLKKSLKIIERPIHVYLFRNYGILQYFLIRFISLKSSLEKFIIGIIVMSPIGEKSLHFDPIQMALTHQ
jgi:hypothetical protein